MALTTQLRVLIEGDAGGLISQLGKAGQQSKAVFSEISRSAKIEFDRARAEVGKLEAEIAKLNKQASSADKRGDTQFASALRTQAAARGAELDKAAIVAVNAEKRIQAEAAKTAAAHAAEAAGVSKLGGAYAQQGGAISRFFGIFTSGGGGASKAATVLKDAVSGLASGTGVLGAASSVASSGIKSLATGLVTAGAAGEGASAGLSAAGVAGEGATAGLVSAGAAGEGAAAGLTAAGVAGEGVAVGLVAAGAAGEGAAAGLAATGVAAEGAAVGLETEAAAAEAATASTLPLAIGLLAVAAGVAVTAKVIQGGIKAFQEFAGQARQVQRLTGASAEEASLAAGAFRRFGIDVDAGGKALGILAKNAETKGGKKLTDLGIEIAHVGKTAKVDLLGTLENVGDAFKKAGTGAEGTNIALQALGRGGAVLIPILAATSGQLKDINKETARQGLKFNQNELNNAKDLSVATREVHQSFEGLQVTAAKGFAPVFTQQANEAKVFLDVLNSLTGRVGGLSSVLGGLGKSSIAGFIPGGSILKAFSDHMSDTGKAGAAAADKLKEVTAAQDEMSAAFEAGSGAIIKAQQADIGFRGDLEKLAKALKANGTTLDTNTEAGRQNVDAALQVALSAENIGTAIAKSTGDIDKGTKAADRHRAVLLEFLTAQLGSADAADKFAVKFGLLDQAGVKAAHGVKLTQDELSQVAITGAQATDSLKGFKDALDAITGANLSAVDSDIRFRESIVEMNKSLLENGRSFDLSTDAGRKNQSALDGAISAAVAHAKAVGDQVAATQGLAAGTAAANLVLQDERNKLIDAETAILRNRDAATKLVDAILKIPPKVAPEFSTPGLPAATTNASTFAAAVEDARSRTESPIVVSYSLHDPFNLRFGGGLGLPPGGFGIIPPGGGFGFNVGRAEGGPAKKGIIYETAERGQELFVSTLRTPSAKSAAAHLAHQAGSAAQEGLVRLGIPAGIQHKSAQTGIPALLLGTKGPQMFTPPTDGVIVKASDTQRLKHSHDADVITDILKRAGLDRKSIDALTNVPHRGTGGTVKKDKTVLAGEQGGTEAFIPKFAMPHRATAAAVTMPGVKRAPDGTYTINIGDTHLKVEANTTGSAKGVNEQRVNSIVERKQAELVEELVAAMRSG